METYRRRVLGLTQGLQHPLTRLLARLGITPNQITLLGLALSLVAAALASQGRFLAAGGVLAFGSALDMVDGMLARATGKASARGALLDSVADRVSEGAVLVGLLWHYGSHPETPWWMPLLVGLALLNGFLVSYVRARAEAVGAAGKAGLMTRPERVVVLVAGLMTGWVQVALGVIAALSLLSWVQRFLDAWRSLKGR